MSFGFITVKFLAEAIRTTVVPIRILIRTTVVPIKILIGTTVVRIRILIGTTRICDFLLSLIMLFLHFNGQFSLKLCFIDVWSKHLHYKNERKTKM